MLLNLRSDELKTNNNMLLVPFLRRAAWRQMRKEKKQGCYRGRHPNEKIKQIS